MKPRISFIVPTYFSVRYLSRCLPPLLSYPEGEVIVVDNHSTDGTIATAAELGAMAYTYGPDQTAGRIFGAPFQRHYGATHARGEYLYFVDVDMIVGHEVVAEAVALGEAGADAVIVAEESFGEGFWAHCKWLERRCYRGDDHIEAPRFIRRDVYEAIGGFDGNVGADDWDLSRRLRTEGYRIARTRGAIDHDEGKLTLSSLARKRFLYARQILKYVRKHRSLDIQQATPFRSSYFRNWRLLASHPISTVGLIIMRGVEFCAAAAGIISSMLAPTSLRLLK